VAPGALAVARATGGVVVPVASASAAGWVLQRAWDRYELPRPFTRVAVALGAPLDPLALGDGAAESRSTARGVPDPLGIGAAIDAARQRAEAALPARAPHGARDRDALASGSRRVV